MQDIGDEYSAHSAACTEASVAWIVVVPNHTGNRRKHHPSEVQQRKYTRSQCLLHQGLDPCTKLKQDKGIQCQVGEISVYKCMRDNPMPFLIGFYAVGMVQQLLLQRRTIKGLVRCNDRDDQNEEHPTHGPVFNCCDRR